MSANFLEQSYTGRAETRRLTDEVVEDAYESVVSTMGPNSELALIIEKNKPVVTKDGVRVAKALDFNEIRKNMIASLITSAAIKTDELVGDGTTTTVFMVYQLYNKFKEHLNFTSTRYLNELVQMTAKHLAGMVTEVTPEDEKFKRMVYTTSNYQEDIAGRVIQLFRDYKTPRVQLRRGVGHPEDVIEVQSNIVFEGRYASPHLQPGTPRGVFEIKEPAVLLLDGQITTLTPGHARGIVDHVIKEGKPIVIFGRFFEPDVLNTLIGLNSHINKELKNPDNGQKLYIIPFILNVAGTAGGNVVKDLGRMTGTDVFSNFPDPETLAWQLKRPADTINLDMHGVNFDASIERHAAKAQAILDEIEPVFEGMTITERANVLGKLLQNRIGRLRAENVLIIVSGMTDAEISERLYLYEDAVRVAETSLRFGVIPGIGYGYNSAAEMIFDKIVDPLEEKSETEQLTAKETSERDLAQMFCEVLVSQYEYLTGGEYQFGQVNPYVDLVRGEVMDEPEYVFDNGCAAISALEAGWSVVKRLAKLSVVLGKSNSSYNV